MDAHGETLQVSDLAEFLLRRPFALIHLDAVWDGYRGILQRRIVDLPEDLTATTSIGYLDVDHAQEYARSIKLTNVPACAYYRGLELVATIIGMNQDIEGNLRLVRAGGTPDSTRRDSRA